jgi:signal transduction histidine kinase
MNIYTIFNLTITIILILNIVICVNLKKSTNLESWSQIDSITKGLIITQFVLSILSFIYLFTLVSQQTLNNSLLLFLGIILMCISSVVVLIFATNPYNLEDPISIITELLYFYIAVCIYLLVIYNKFIIRGSEDINKIDFDSFININRNYQSIPNEYTIKINGCNRN